MLAKMVMITYNEAIEDEVLEELAAAGLANYTKIPAVYGKGASSGTHEGTDIWPGRNNLLFVACNQEQAKQAIISIRKLRETLGAEGVKAFVFALEDLT